MARAQRGDLLLGPSHAALFSRAAYIEGLGYAVKAETVAPGNAAKGLPTIQGTVLLHDAQTGAVRAIIESKLVTEYKTAADSVLGAQLLARPDSQHLVIVGGGVVARSLVRAYSAAFPMLRRISVWARRPDQARALVASLRGIPAELAIATELRAAVQTADIVSAATMAREPILGGDWIRAGTHVDLIGGYTPDMREADDALMAKGTVFVDCRETTIECVGDLVQPIASGVMKRADVCGDLYDLMAASGPMRETASQVTIFKNGGGAHLDLMIADYVADVVSQCPFNETASITSPCSSALAASHTSWSGRKP
ncbi:ornithine cyclodeaminase (plasmid) [Pseudomonas aeruginosa]|nr:ornithine cyclodeaminase [Pseudomonas aeruginosa]HBO0862836.1 ornithine cyclodeaminase [Pseudomonas aeruginosa]HBO5215074.1 ornithine cyclodeaminase [Pseudomonas aeruginosa]HCE6881760.1 ornithine cyclodeaminase [Pseudomonas aeruginosa]HCE9350691.1 ornithine cyclodeaminase [Pseudomonas aeruginosa]